MPTQWSHPYFWHRRANPVVAAVPTIGGYPRWQSSIIAGSWLGALQTYWERLVYVGWWAWQASQWTATQRSVMGSAYQLALHPAFPLALAAVADTAGLPEFNRPHAWTALGHKLKENHGTAENSWRHLHAMTQLSEAADAQGIALSNPQRNAVIELAYLAFAAQPKRPRFPLYVT